MRKISLPRGKVYSVLGVYVHQTDQMPQPGLPFPPRSRRCRGDVWHRPILDQDGLLPPPDRPPRCPAIPLPRMRQVVQLADVPPVVPRAQAGHERHGAAAALLRRVNDGEPRSGATRLETPVERKALAVCDEGEPCRAGETMPRRSRNLRVCPITKHTQIGQLERGVRSIYQTIPTICRDQRLYNPAWPTA